MVKRILLCVTFVLFVLVGGEVIFYSSIKKTVSITKTPAYALQSIASPEENSLPWLLKSLESDTTKGMILTVTYEGSILEYEKVAATKKIKGGSDKEIKIVLKSPRGDYYNNNIYLNESMLQRTSFVELENGKEVPFTTDKIKIGQKIDIISTIDVKKMDTTKMKIILLNTP